MFLSPGTQDLSLLFNAANEHPILTKPIYNKDTFEPRCYIIMSYSPTVKSSLIENDGTSVLDNDVTQQLLNLKVPSISDEEYTKQMLINQLIELLNNPTEHAAPEEKFLLARVLIKNKK